MSSTNQGATAPENPETIEEMVKKAAPVLSQYMLADFGFRSPPTVIDVRVRKVLEAAGVPALSAQNAALKEALRFYADPSIYKPHPHGPAFDRRDLSFRARTAIKEAGADE